MASVDHGQREIRLKIVYYGPGFGGKTTNLEYIHGHVRPELRGKLISLADEGERTLFFDLLALELGSYKGYGVRLHLCTVPGQLARGATRKLVLRHTDAVVFVADSQPAAMDANLVSVDDLYESLAVLDLDQATLPLVLQLNKQDLPGAMDPERLAAVLAFPSGIPAFGAAAKSGIGVFETLRSAIKSALANLGDPAEHETRPSPSIVPGRRLSTFPDAVAPMLRAAPGSWAPPRVPRFEPWEETG